MNKIVPDTLTMIEVIKQRDQEMYINTPQAYAHPNIFRMMTFNDNPVERQIYLCYQTIN